MQSCWWLCASPRPVGRCLIGKGLRYLELVDKKELSKALKGRSIDYSIQGSEIEQTSDIELRTKTKEKGQDYK